jgi:hypothetical protein
VALAVTRLISLAIVVAGIFLLLVLFGIRVFGTMDLSIAFALLGVATVFVALHGDGEEALL